MLPVLSTANWVRLCVQGAVMTVGSLVVYQIAEPEYGAAVASTMLLTTLSLFHLAGGLLARDQVNTIFDRSAIPGTIQLRRYGIALVAIVAVTALGYPATDLLDGVAQLLAVVDLHRHRGKPRDRRGAHQGLRPPAGRARSREREGGVSDGTT